MKLELNIMHKLMGWCIRNFRVNIKYYRVIDWKKQGDYLIPPGGKLEETG